MTDVPTYVSDDSDSEDDYAGPLREGGTEIREVLKNFVWGNLLYILNVLN